MPMWLRALLLCDDVRFEIGGTVTLVGVHAERILVERGDTGAAAGTEGEAEVTAVGVELGRLAIYAVVAGIRGSQDVGWRMTITGNGPTGDASSTVLAEGSEHHDPAADEHRLVHIIEPLVLPGIGDYRLLVNVVTALGTDRRELRFGIEHALE